MWHSIWNQMYKLKLVDEKEATEFGKYVTESGKGWQKAFLFNQKIFHCLLEDKIIFS